MDGFGLQIKHVQITDTIPCFAQTITVTNELVRVSLLYRHNLWSSTDSIFQIQKIGEQGWNNREPSALTLQVHIYIICKQLLQKTGQIERTVDREFTEEEAKYRTYVLL